MESPQNQNKDNPVKHFINSFKYSINGISSCFKTEMAFRMELSLITVLFPLSFIISQSLVELLVLICTLFLLVIVELLNTAIENVIDKTIPQHSTRAGMAKDQGSAAVFMSLWLIGIVWVSLIVKNFEVIMQRVTGWF